MTHGFLKDIRGNKSTTRLLTWGAFSLSVAAWIIGVIWTASEQHARWGAEKMLEFAKWIFLAGKGGEELMNGIKAVAEKVKGKDGGEA